MIVVTLARKPVLEVVARNALQHGTGGLNIDKTRISSESRPLVVSARGHGQGSTFAGGLDGSLHGSRYAGSTSKGRWPANLILEHKPDCRQDGTRTIGHGERRAAGAGVKPFDDKKGWNSHSMTRDGASAPENYGEETVPIWICEPGCPIREMDTQSGNVPGGRAVNNQPVGWMYNPIGIRNFAGYNDAGGASRFFKIVGGSLE